MYIYRDLHIYSHGESLYMYREREFKNQIFSPVLRAPFEDNKI